MSSRPAIKPALKKLKIASPCRISMVDPSRRAVLTVSSPPLPGGMDRDVRAAVSVMSSPQCFGGDVSFFKIMRPHMPHDRLHLRRNLFGSAGHKREDRYSFGKFKVACARSSVG